MKRAIILQSRMGSRRLPGKVLQDLLGSPMLVQQLKRLEKCSRADEIVIATTTERADDAIVDLADRHGVRWFRGSEKDVLSRYLGAATECNAEIIVRVT